MKEWENWWDRHEEHYNAIRCATEDGWKAGLKWVLNSIEKGDEYHLTRKGICILIKQELEDETKI